MSIPPVTSMKCAVCSCYFASWEHIESIIRTGRCVRCYKFATQFSKWHPHDSKPKPPRRKRNDPPRGIH